MATGTSQGQPFGTIQSVSGQAKIIGVDGSTRPVVVGGKIFNNEMILTTANANVRVQLGNGQNVDIVGGSEYQVGVDAAPGAGGADEGGGGSATILGQGAPGAGPTAGFGTEPVGGRVIGTIVESSGQATATSPDGTVRTLGVGDRVFANETVTSSSGGPVNISLAGGGSLECGPGATLTLNPSLLSVGKPSGGIADIQAAILAGADPSQVADPTAAGAPAAGGSEEGRGGSRVIINLEQANSSGEVTAGFATFGAGIGFPQVEFQLLAPGEIKPIASLLPLGPTVIEGTDGGTSHVIHFTIQLDKTVNVAVGVNFLITPPGADGNGADVSSPFAGTAIIPAGASSVVVDIAIVQDHFVEFNEPVSITLTAAINATINPAADTATITIIDDDINPVAVDDTNWVQEDSAVTATGNVLEDRDHSRTPSEPFADVKDVDTDAIHVTTTGAFAGALGTLVLQENGGYIYTLYTPAENAAANALVQALDSNDAALIDTFTYTISDGFNPPDSATLSISVFGSNDGPGIIVNGETGGVHDVYEAGLPLGSDVGPTTTEVTGDFILSDPDGLDDLDAIKVGDSVFSIAQLSAATDSVVGRLLVADTSAGALFVTGYDGSTGVVSYRYVLDTATAQADSTSQNVFQVSVSDDGVNFTAPVAVTVTIHDDEPAADDDSGGAVIEDGAGAVNTPPTSSVSGNVLNNDTANADTPKDFVSWSATGHDNTAAVAGLNTYGTLTQNVDGSWSYSLDNSRAATQGLTVSTNLSFDVWYTMTDADGDTSAATLTITIQGSTDTGAVVTALAQGPDATVLEHGLTSSGDTTETTSGTFAVSASDGILNVNIGGTTFTLAQVQAFNGTQTVNTGEGVLTLTAYTGNSFGGTIDWSYTLSATIDNDSKVPSGNDALTLTHFDDSVHITVNGIGGTSAGDDLVVRAIDDAPVANDDAGGTATEDGAGAPNTPPTSTVSGNVLPNDVQGADQTGSLTTEFVSWTATGHNNAPALASLNTYGTWTPNVDGSWSYTLDNTRAATQALTSSSNLSFDVWYTMTDADGDQAIAKLTINIVGANDTQTVTVQGVGGVTTTVYETALTLGVTELSNPALNSDLREVVSGSFSVSASDGIAKITVLGTDFTLLQLQTIHTSGTPSGGLSTGEGTLRITDYVSADDKSATISYSYTLTGTITNATPATTFFDDINNLITVTGVSGVSSSASDLQIRIMDDAPVANDDAGGTATEDGAGAPNTPPTSTVSGNVLPNDVQGADQTGSLTTEFVSWTATGHNNAPALASLNTYGTWTPNVDGSWSYTLDNTRAATQALTSSSNLSFDVWYTMTDADGDQAIAKLTINIVGANDTQTVTVQGVGGVTTTVYETALTLGVTELSNPALNSDLREVVSGSFSVSASDGIAKITVLGTDFTLLQLQTIHTSGTPSGGLSTGEGTLRITDYVSADDKSATISYSYTLTGTITNATPATTFFDDINNLITVTGVSGVSSSASDLQIRIMDDAPVANDDAGGTATEDGAGAPNTPPTSTVSGNVLPNDVQGADQTGSLTTEFVSWTATGHNNAPALASLNTYGTWTPNVDGSWSYTLDNTRAATQALTSSSNLSFDVWYTMTDADGDQAIAKLTINIVGANDTQTVTVQGVGGVTTTVYETALTLGVTELSNPALNSDLREVVSGSFSVSASDGIAKITVLGTDFTLLQLQTIHTSGTPSGGLSTGEGTLRITDYVSADDKSATISYSYTLTGTITNATPATTFFDDINNLITVTGVSGVSSSASDLQIRIMDDAPVANDDAGGTATEDGAGAPNTPPTSTVSGNVLPNDVQGADQTGSLTTEFVSWTATGHNNAPALASLNTYGTWTPNVDGSWSYTLDNTRAATQALTSSSNLSFDVWYTMTDADGDQAIAKLTINIVGANDTQTVTVQGVGGVTTTVYETALTLGVTELSNPALNSDLREVVSGSFSVSASDGIAKITVLGTDFTLLQLQTIHTSGTPSGGLSTGEGTLRITDYVSADDKSATISYSYTLTGTITNATPATTFFDDINNLITVTGVSGVSSSASDLQIRIMDDAPVANDDAGGTATEDGAGAPNTPPTSTVSGNVLPNDVQGADQTGSLTTEFVSWTATGHNNAPALASLNTYGTWTPNVDGSWSYTLDNTRAATQALTSSSNLSFDVWYTMTDADGDQAIAKLTITITGANDGPVAVDRSVWMPDDLAQLPADFTYGWPLNVPVPTDVDGDTLEITVNLDLDFIGELRLADGSLVSDGDTLTVAEFSGLSYMPDDDDVADTEAFTYTVADGNGAFVTKTVELNTELGTPFSKSAILGARDGSPLNSGTSGKVESSITFSQEDVDTISSATLSGHVELITDFSQQPASTDPEFIRSLLTQMSVSVIVDEDGNLATLGDQTEFFLILNGQLGDGSPDPWVIHDDPLIPGPVAGYDDPQDEGNNPGGTEPQDSWFAEVSFTNAEDSGGGSLADYLADNPLDAGDTWLFTYFDSTGGNAQARFVEGKFFFTEDGVTPAINVVGSDTLPNTIWGGSTGDTLVGGSLDDLIAGLGGSDILTGGDGTDTFKWRSGDDGTAAFPATDTITDDFADNPDKLDLSELLVGENYTDENNIGNLATFLSNFLYDSGSDTTTFDVSPTGAGGDVTQKLVVGGDLTLGGTLTSAEIIANLIQQSKLIADQS